MNQVLPEVTSTFSIGDKVFVLVSKSEIKLGEVNRISVEYSGYDKLNVPELKYYIVWFEKGCRESSHEWFRDLEVKRTPNEFFPHLK